MRRDVTDCLRHMSTRRVVETLARRMSGPSRARRVGGAYVQVLHPGADARDATCAVGAAVHG